MHGIFSPSVSLPVVPVKDGIALAELVNPMIKLGGLGKSRPSLDFGLSHWLLSLLGEPASFAHFLFGLSV